MPIFLPMYACTSGCSFCALYTVLPLKRTDRSMRLMLGPEGALPVFDGVIGGSSFGFGLAGTVGSGVTSFRIWPAFGIWASAGTKARQRASAARARAEFRTFRIADPQPFTVRRQLPTRLN